MTLGVIDFGTLSPLSVYVALAITGLFTGLGSSLGIYIMQTHIIKKSQQLSKKIKRKLKRKKRGR
jgi:hypothetical protein